MFLCRPTMVGDIFEEFDPPSKKFLATPLITTASLVLLLSDLIEEYSQVD